MSTTNEPTQPQADRLQELRDQKALQLSEQLLSPTNGQDQENVHEVHYVHSAPGTAIDVPRFVAEVEELIIQAKDNPGIYAGSAFTGTVKLIREHDEAAWLGLRVLIKREKPSGVLLSDIDKATQPSNYSSGQQGVKAILMDIVESQCPERFFDKRTRTGYVTVMKEGVSHTLNVKSEPFSEWLSYAFYTDTGTTVSETAVREVIASVSGLCKFDGQPSQVFLRAGRDEETGAYYLFMADEKMRAIEITHTGWRILDSYPVKFCLSNSSTALPEPVPGGDIEQLWDFANIPENDRPLVLAWILESYRVNTPFPVLELNGVQGSAKSNTQKRLRSLIDPSGSMLRQRPERTEDIFIAGANNWLLSYENVSFLKPELQDTFCIVATSGGFAKRGLYTNSDEYVIEVMRPIVLNGIPNSITAQDLVDRSIHVELPELRNRQREADMDAAFATAHPAILGGILDLFVAALALLPSITVPENAPRMVDFTVLGEAMMQSQGHPPGTFTDLYKDNRRESVLCAIDSSPVIVALVALADSCIGPLVYEGNYRALLDILQQYKRDNDGWPKSEKGLANQIKRQLPALREVGIFIHYDKGRKSSKNGYQIIIRKDEHGEQDAHAADSPPPREQEAAPTGLFESVKHLRRPF